MDEATEAEADEDLQYLQRRAEEELEAAQRSTVPEVTAAHYQLAEAYLDRIEDKQAAPAGGGGAEETAGRDCAEPATVDREKPDPLHGTS